MKRFDQTYCSQCGGAFGPGDHGFSHCSDHTGQQPQPEPAAWMWEFTDPHTGNRKQEPRKNKPRDWELLSGELVVPLYTTPPDLLQMLHECAEYIAALNGEQDDYCQRARALIARATGEVK